MTNRHTLKFSILAAAILALALPAAAAAQWGRYPRTATRITAVMDATTIADSATPYTAWIV